jgi:hypothetical protein
LDDDGAPVTAVIYVAAVSAFDQTMIKSTQISLYILHVQCNTNSQFDDDGAPVTAVMYVAAISAFDQTMYENDGDNRLREDISLFEEVCENECVRGR